MKPCPFCGGKAEIVSMSEKFTVSCASGGCMANIAWCPDEEKAARAWNARTLDWIPCSERMPEDLARVLFAFHGSNVRSGFRNGVFGSRNAWYSEGFHYDDNEITHWMPTPEPPGGV